jgi:peroxiredoxin
MNNWLHAIKTDEAGMAARAKRYAAAAAIGVVAGLFFSAVARMVISAASAILTYVS